jgi:hypothetical protein
MTAQRKCMRYDCEIFVNFEITRVDAAMVVCVAFFSEVLTLKRNFGDGRGPNTVLQFCRLNRPLAIDL